METFPLPWVFQADKEVTYATHTVVFESMKEQVQRMAVNPSVTWHISVRGSNEDRVTLEQFHQRVAGNYGVFLFTDENDVEQQCRFAEPKLSIKMLREFTTSNVTHGNVVGFTADIVIKKVL